jgi:hypothetical protein
VTIIRWAGVSIPGRAAGRGRCAADALMRNARLGGRTEPGGYGAPPGRWYGALPERRYGQGDPLWSPASGRFYAKTPEEYITERLTRLRRLLEKRNWYRERARDDPVWRWERFPGFDRSLEWEAVR